MNHPRRALWACTALAWTIGVAGLLGSSTAIAAPSVLTRDSFSLIRARHSGQPLVVHVWGMTCGPCLVDLPKWGELRRQRPDMHLVLIQADQTPPQASEQRLRSVGLVTAENWMAGSELDEFLRASIDPLWQGEMPRTLLIAPNGDITRMSGTGDLSQVRRWLDGHSRRAR
jgi:hypothetical protein